MIMMLVEVLSVAADHRHEDSTVLPHLILLPTVHLRITFRDTHLYSSAVQVVMSC